jgi:hypothetical protein
MAQAILALIQKLTLGVSLSDLSTAMNFVLINWKA